MSTTKGKLRRGGTFQTDIVVVIKALKKKTTNPSTFSKLQEIRCECERVGMRL